MLCRSFLTSRNDTSQSRVFVQALVNKKEKGASFLMEEDRQNITELPGIQLQDEEEKHDQSLKASEVLQGDETAQIEEGSGNGVQSESEAVGQDVDVEAEADVEGEEDVVDEGGVE
ncbi:MAG: hypothetical protein BA865_09640 [Desulfobacterales bacterium S5133MH4]|nr:MAG: hypothetical protein BA865_09640 [Desulfobacterales bacterium S5133MH4]